MDGELVFSRILSKTISIDNNAAGTYDVHGYKVYVDTKGNDQIRALYFVNLVLPPAPAGLAGIVA